MAGLPDAGWAVAKFVWRVFPNRWRRERRIDGRPGWIDREYMLDVGQDEFLVLLLVAETDLDEEIEVLVAAFFGDQIEHRVVDVLAIGEDLVHRRACQQATVGTWVHSSDGVKIGIQDIVEVLVKPVVGLRVFLENEALPKPRNVRKMPFRRADVWHALHDVVLWLEVLA